MYFRLTNADLLWNDVIERPIPMENGQHVRGYGPINGTVYSPKLVWRSNETDDWSLGLQVVIAVNGDWLAVVPIERDQLRPEKAFFRRELSAIKLLR